MFGYIVRRLFYTVIIIVLASMIAFFVLHYVPGDPTAALLGSESTPERQAEVRHELWLDRPVVVQYIHWVDNMLHGNLGKSLSHGEPVYDIVKRSFPITAFLSGLAMIISAVVGISIGIICAVKRGSFLDNILTLFANVGIAVPIFWLGLLGIYLFAYKLGWLPIQGFVWPTQGLGNSISHLIMPVICLSVPSLAVMARQTRSSMLEVIRQDYIRTAKSKGLRENTVTLRHALRNALIPVVTLLGIQIRTLVSGSILVETVFNIPGMGRQLVGSALELDFITLQVMVLLVSAIVCLANLTVDISYGWLDPRTRYD